MHREELIAKVRETLARAGFYVSKPLNMRSISFDVVARRDRALLIIKILSNVDAFSKENADEMKALAEALQASPLMVGERSGSGPVEDGIVYSRFSVPIICAQTLTDLLLDGIPPFIFAAPGGLYVKLDSLALRKARDERGISLGNLAEVAGVSRRTIQMYESGMGAMIDVAVRLEDYLNQPIVVPVDIMDYRHAEATPPIPDAASMDDFTKQIFLRLEHMGFSVVPTAKCPFEALTKDHEVLILTGVGHKETKLVEKAKVVSDLGKVTERRSVIFIERVKSRSSIEGTALIGRDELKAMDEADKLFHLVEQRSSDSDAKR
ncbi:MAG TPA: transcriptional regulator [Methanomassiliicoccales archaeon]|nr:transcriptional regulator [Methanomassiliicoccales archaeon]